jgi:hypothetical protein
MADGPALALQAALVARLKANAGISTLVGARVYDEPPQNVVFPYVRIGAVDARALRLSGTFVDEDIIFGIECYSQPVAGRVEASRIAHAVRLALDAAPLTVTGYRLDWCQWMTQAVQRQADGRSYVATLAFEAALSPA